MSKKQTTSEQKLVLENFIDRISSLLSYSQRQIIGGDVSAIVEIFGLDVDKNKFLSDRRFGNAEAGPKNTATYFAVWVETGRYAYGPLSTLSEELNCSVQVLYKHRRKAMDEGLEFFYKKDKHSPVRICEYTSDEEFESLVDYANSIKKEVSARGNSSVNEDGSY